MLTERHTALLEARGLDAELLARLGVKSCERRGAEWIEIPYFEGAARVNAKYRTISGPKEFHQEAGARSALYNVNCLTDPALDRQPIIITEGEWDCISAIQAGFARAVSVPNGAPAEPIADQGSARYAYLDNAPKALFEAPEIILAVDGDNPGAALLADLSLRLGRARCKWVRYPRGCKDLNDALQRYGERGVVETITRAQWMALDGVYRMSELPPIVVAEPLDSGFPGLALHYRLRLGDFCVITGVPGSGKTTFANDLACRMVVRHGWPVCFASFEQLPQIDHRRWLRSWYASDLVKNLDARAIVEADSWIERNFVFLVPSDEDTPNLPWLLSRCSDAVIRYGVRLIIIDPWNEIEHDRPRELSLTEYVGAALREFKVFARKHQIHLIIVAHPAKMRRENGKFPMPALYDISDSAAWANRADIGIIVHRETEEATIIKIAKSRYHDQIGKPGEVHARYVWERSTYEPATDELGVWVLAEGG